MHNGIVINQNLYNISITAFIYLILKFQQEEVDSWLIASTCLLTRELKKNEQQLSCCHYSQGAIGNITQFER